MEKCDGVPFRVPFKSRKRDAALLREENAVPSMTPFRWRKCNTKVPYMPCFFSHQSAGTHFTGSCEQVLLTWSQSVAFLPSQISLLNTRILQ